MRDRPPPDLLSFQPNEWGWGEKAIRIVVNTWNKEEGDSQL